ncbi:MAG: type VI secretion system baseplate subunit TssK [Desulfovibrionaceae bacterium]|nr:type VI secretion system baseplate subunit TssK [Desulfovibrionaceae bacterium]
MYSEKRLFWEQGTLLQPQHFQLQDLQSFEDGWYPAALLCPYLWGISKISIREEALQTQIFTVDDLDMLFPDGARIIAGKNAVLASKSFAKLWTNRDHPLTVYIGLMPFSSQGGNTVEKELLPGQIAETEARFIAPVSPAQIPDLHGSGPDAEIRFMLYNARVLFETETDLLSRMSAVPVARLIQNGDRVELDPDYIPPCISIRASETLMRITETARNILLARVDELSDYRIPFVQGSQVTVTMQSLGCHLLLSILSRSLPLLEHLRETPNLHPWLLYALFRQIFGELSIFTGNLSPLGETESGERFLPATYCHDNLRACFGSIPHYLKLLTASFARRPDGELAFTEQQDRSLRCILQDLPPEPYAVWLQVRSADMLENIRLNIQERAKLAATSDLWDLVTYALPGIPLSFSEMPPGGLPKRSDTAFFRIHTETPLWKAALAQQSLSLFLPDMIPNGMLQLILMRE